MTQQEDFSSMVHGRSSINQICFFKDWLICATGESL